MDGMSDTATIQTTHRVELDELDDALLADDDCGRHGFGDVLWVSERRPVEAVVDWLRTVA